MPLPTSADGGRAGAGAVGLVGERDEAGRLVGALAHAEDAAAALLGEAVARPTPRR